MKRHILTVSILLVAAQLFGQESRFWVGGSGKWSDTNHWSVTSGGEPGAALPESGTSVVFDENSFSSGKNTVTFNSDVTVGSLTAKDASFVFSGKNNITVGGSVNTDANASFGKLRGSLVLAGSGENTINIADGLESPIVIDGGSWTLLSDLTTEGNITLKSGSLNTAGYNVTCAVFTASENAKLLNIENSTIICDSWFTNSAEKMTVKAEGSEIVLRNSLLTGFSKAPRQIYNVIKNYSASKEYGYKVDAIVTKQTSCPESAWEGIIDDGEITVTINDGTGTFKVLAIHMGTTPYKREFTGNPVIIDKAEAGTWEIGYVNDFHDKYFQNSVSLYIGPENFKGINEGEGINVVGPANCWGDDIALNSDVSGGTKPYTYEWENGTLEKKETTTDPLYNFSVGLGAMVGLTITDAHGCQVVANGQVPWYYTVNSKHKYNGDYSGPELITAEYDIEPSCEGESSGILTINATGGSESFTQYEIEGVETKGTPTFSGLAAGTYIIKITDTKGCSNLDHNADFNILSATIGDIPKPKAEVDNAESIVCFSDGEFTINDAHASTTKSGVKPESILWSVKSGTAASIKSGADTETPTLTLNAPGDVTFTMTVKNGTCTAATVDKTIHVIPVPAPILKSIGHNVCGLSETLDADEDPLIAGEFSLVAYYEGEKKVQISGLTVTVPEPGEYTFKVKEIATTAHCEGLSVKSVTLNFYNTPEVSLATTSSSICGIVDVPLSATVKNGKIKWTSDGAGSFGDDESFETTYTPDNSDLDKVLTLTATVSNDGCAPVHADYTLTVNRVPSPAAPIVAAEVCGLATPVSATPSIGGVLEWKSTEGTVQFGSGNSTTATVTSATTYHIYVEETKNGCSEVSPAVEVIFYDEPEISITTGTSGKVCGNETFSLAASTNCDETKIVWSGGAGSFSPTTGKNTVYTPAAADYGNTITITASVPSNHPLVCSDPVPATFELTVGNVPAPTIAAIGTGANGDVCGLSVTATATASLGGTLSWNNGGDNTLQITPSTGATVTVSGDNGVTYGITVTETKDGCSAPSPVQYVTFHAAPEVSVPAASDVCESDIVSVTATATNATGLNWSITNGAGTFTQTGDASSMTITYTPAAGDINKDVILTATADNGGICSVAEKQYKFHVYANPNPSIASLINICGNTDEITGTISAGNTVTWDIPAEIETSGKSENGTTASITLTLKEGSAYGDYTITMTETNTAGCLVSVTTTVRFEAKPVIEFNTNEAKICAGDEFVVEVKKHENFVSYQWGATEGGTLVLGDHKATVKTLPSTIYKEVIVTAIPKGGCEEKPVASMTLIVNPMPEPNIDDKTVCGLVYDLPTTVSSVTGITSDFGWSTPDVSGKVRVIGNQFIATEEGTYKLHLTEYIAGSDCQAFDDAEITFVAKPEANAGDDDAVCFDETTYELSAATADHHAGLVWSSSSTGEFSTDLNPTYTFSAADKTNGSVTLTLTAKAKTPCGTEDDAVSSITITINPLPEPTISGPAKACPNDENPSVYTTELDMSDYQWYIDGVAQAGATSNSFSQQWTVAGTYKLTVGYTDGKGCKGVSNEFEVIVNSLPESGLAANAESCTNGNVTLNATVTTGGSGNFSYAWSGTGVDYLSDANIANPTFESTVAGEYTLTCTISDIDFGCSISAQVVIDNKQGPAVDAGEDKAVCYNLPQQMDDATASDYESVKWTTDGDGSFDDETAINAIYTPGDADKLAGTVTLTLTANSATCGSISDDVVLTIQPELLVAVGTVKPFDIQSSTKISVKIEGTYSGGNAAGLQFYLVAPDGTEVALYEHNMSSADWARWPGEFDLEFTTESDLAPSFEIFDPYQKASEHFSITGNWSDIYGKNPAEGGWSVKLGGKWTSKGFLTRATIVFSDYEDNDPSKSTKTIKFDSKKKDPGIYIPDGLYLSYISPIGLNVSCRNLCDAHAIAKGIGGSGVYTSFEWSTTPGFEAENIIGSGELKDLCVGTYYVRVTDAMGCTAITEVEVGAPDDIHINIDDLADATCNGASNGIINVSAYKENVTNFDFLIEGFQATSLGKDWAHFTTLPEGTYEVVVIDEDNCRDSVTYNIGQPAKLEITQIDTTLATSCTVSNGAVTFTVTGGKVEGDYHMEYMGLPQDQPDMVIDQATLTATGLSGASGIRFRIYDAGTFDPLDLEAGCFVDTAISTLAKEMEFEFAKVENTCNGAEEASITVTVSNGSGDYQFEWYDENGLVATTTESTVSGLAAGVYYVKVTDNATNCDATSNNIELTDPDPIVITKTITSMPKCLGDETASFSLSAEGGMPGAVLTYEWKKNGVVIDNPTNSFDGVGAGKYTVIVTDGFCEAKDTIEVIEPTSKLAIVDYTTEESECVAPTGSATVTIDGGYGAITYEWTLLRESSVKYSGPLATVSNMGAGNYKLRVADELGCADSTTVKIEDKGGLMAQTEIVEDVLCADRPTGKALITGVYDADYNTYDAEVVWADGTTHPVSDVITGLKFGENYVTVIAENGCISDEIIEIKGEDALKFVDENTFSEPDVLGDPNNNGQIIAVIAGGKKAYSYAWFDAGNNEITSNTESGEERATLRGLKEGTYSLIVTDNNLDVNGEGCQISREFTVEFAPVKITLAETSPVTCYDGNNGELTATVTGGYKNDTYYYEWRNLTNGEVVKSNGSQTATVSTLMAGNYEVKVMQRNNLAKDSAVVVLTQPLTRLSVPSVAIDSKGSYCYEATGSIKINEPASEEAQQKNFGGTLPFKYKFNYSDWTADSVETSRLNPEITKLVSGTYTLVVEDARGCLSDTMEVVVPDSSNFTIKRIEPKKICYGSDDGVITIDAKVNDGSDYQYAWSNNATTKNIDNLKAGTYSVTVTATVKEQYTCEETETFEVEQYAPIMFSVSNSIVNSCYNSADGVVSLANLRGGNNTYRRFEFFDLTGKQLFDSIPSTFADTTATLSFSGLLAAGEYKVVVTDGDLNCHSDSVSLKVYSATPKIEIAELIDDEPLCYEYDKNGKLSYGKITVDARAITTAQVSSTTTDLAVFYKLDGGDSQTAHIFSNVTAGQHTITVGFGDKQDCPVEIEHELKSKNNLKANAAFRNNQKVIFTCPDNLLSAYVTADNKFNTFKFYTMYNEDAENYGKVKEVEPQPADTAADATAYRFNRGIYYRADSLGGVDSTITEPVVEEIVYNHGTDIRGNQITLFAEGNGSEGKVWADDFMPYGRETFYYFEIADNQCASIDSIRAVAMFADEKLKAVVSMEDATSDDLLINGEYEVAEGAPLILTADQLKFTPENVYVYSESSWLWASAPADHNEGSGLRPESTLTENTIVAQAYGRLYAKVRDSVAFELNDLVYNVDTTMVCYYYDSVIVNSISGIRPADVVLVGSVGKHNKWRIEGLASYDKVTIYVFNRWGGRVWQYSGSGKEYSDAHEWNGRNEKNKPVPSGTYYYVIQCSDGILGGKKVTGPVTVIR